MAKKASKADAVIKELREYGLKLPGTHLKSPWPGHKDLAVNDKTFAYLPPEGQPFGISCKLPKSSNVALMLPWCTPTPYGLGKSGWVSAQPPAGEIDVDMFKSWIDESYRAQAPKKYLKQLDGGAAPATKPVSKKPRAAASKRKR
jgi:predicted DNA-binding protein (MmcQ/YjbR family)